MKKDVRAEFYELLENRGFKSLREFARKADIKVENIHSNLTGQYSLSIGRAFIIATTLGVSIDTILEMFYPEEMEKVWNAIED